MAAEAEEEVRLEVEAVYGDDHRMVRDFPPPHLVVHVHPRTADDPSQQMLQL